MPVLVSFWPGDKKVPSSNGVIFLFGNGLQLFLGNFSFVQVKWKSAFGQPEKYKSHSLPIALWVCTIRGKKNLNNVEGFHGLRIKKLFFPCFDWLMYKALVCSYQIFKYLDTGGYGAPQVPNERFCKIIWLQNYKKELTYKNPLLNILTSSWTPTHNLPPKNNRNPYLEFHLLDIYEYTQLQEPVL